MDNNTHLTSAIKKLTALSLLSMLLVAVAVYLFIFEPNAKNSLERILLRDGTFLANNHLSATDFSYPSSQITNPAMQYIYKNMKRGYIGFYDEHLGLLTSEGRKESETIIAEQYNSECGIRSIITSLKGCTNTNGANYINAYIPIDKDGEFKGMVYLEMHKFGLHMEFMQTIFYWLLIMLLVGSVFALLIYKKIKDWIQDIENGFSAPSGRNTKEVAWWVNKLRKPLENELSTVNLQNIKLEEENKKSNDQMMILERQIKRVRLEAQEAIESKTKRLAQASHDIRSPLHTILGLSEILLEKAYDANQKLKLVSIYEAAFGLKREVDNILIYETSEIDNVDIALEKTDIEKEVDSLVQQIGLQYSTQKPVIAFSDIDRDVPRFISTYKIAIIKILTNLAGNARKFTENGYVSLHVGYQKKTDTNGKLIITIQDTGRGMSKDQVNNFGRHFKQYHQDSSGQGGVGLGLKIVHEYQQKINAVIDVESTVNKGTKFRISLDVTVPEISESFNKEDNAESVCIVRNSLVNPSFLEEKFIRHNYTNVSSITFDDLGTNKDIANHNILVFYVTSKLELNTLTNELNEQAGINYKAIIYTYFDDIRINKDILKRCIVTGIHTPFQQVLDSLNNIQFVGSSNSHWLENLHILSVDDDHNNLNIIEHFLEPYCCHIESVTDPFKAIEKAKSKKYDFILMDIMMPQMAGYEASSIIRKNGANQSTPIVAATATVSSTEKDKIFASEMTDILIKPFSKKTLLSVIEKNLQDTQQLSTDDSEYKIEAEIKKHIRNYRGTGDINSDLTKLIELEQIATLVIFSEYTNLITEFLELVTRLKHAIYGNTEPVESTFEEIDKILVIFEVQILNKEVVSHE